MAFPAHKKFKPLLEVINPVGLLTTWTVVETVSEQLFALETVTIYVESIVGETVMSGLEAPLFHK